MLLICMRMTHLNTAFLKGSFDTCGRRIIIIIITSKQMCIQPLRRNYRGAGARLRVGYYYEIYSAYYWCVCICVLRLTASVNFFWHTSHSCEVFHPYM